MQLWRISDYADLLGNGGMFADGRWHTMGRPIIYSSESSAGALSELLVHIDRGSLAPEFQLIRLEVPGELALPHMVSKDVTWPLSLEQTRSLGDEWLSSRQTVLMRVPSAIIADSFNVLINPVHPDVSRIKIADVKKVKFDPRLK